MEEPHHSSIQQYIPSDEYRPEPETKPLLPAWLDGSTRIGIHTSIAGDICSALDIAKGLGANALQIFSSSPRMWSRGTPGSKALEASSAKFRARREELHLGPLVIHTNYLINLASCQRVLRVRSIQAFHDEIVRAVSLGADFLVMHPGCACGVEMLVGEKSRSIRGAADGFAIQRNRRGVRIVTQISRRTRGRGKSAKQRG